MDESDFPKEPYKCPLCSFFSWHRWKFAYHIVSIHCFGFHYVPVHACPCGYKGSLLELEIHLFSQRDYAEHIKRAVVVHSIAEKGDT